MPVASVSKMDIKRNATTTLREVIPWTATHKVCSIYPKEVIFPTHGGYVLPACDDKAPKNQTGEVEGIKYTFIEVHPGRNVEDKSVDTGNQFLERYEVKQEIPAYTVALDLAGYAVAESGAISETHLAKTHKGRGIFVPVGDVPTKQELLDAKQAWLESAVVEYDAAQSSWAQNRKTSNITDHARLAAHLLGKNPEWLGGLEASTGQRPKSEVELLTELVKELILNRAQGSVPANSAAAPAFKGR